MKSGGKAKLQGNVSSDYVSHVPLQLLIMQSNLLTDSHNHIPEIHKHAILYLKEASGGY